MSNSIATLPIFPGIDDVREERAELVAGLTFVEGACGWSRTDLGEWFRAHGRALGREAAPVSVRDRTVGGTAPVRLDSEQLIRHERLSRLLSMARWKVILTLRGLVSTPVNDRFLSAAIFSGRVRRERAAWRVQVADDHALSEIVLALFAADVLAHREFHEQNLCICDICGRVSYSPARTTRNGCVEHVPAGGPPSGLRRSPRPLGEP